MISNILETGQRCTNGWTPIDKSISNPRLVDLFPLGKGKISGAEFKFQQLANYFSQRGDTWCQLVPL